MPQDQTPTFLETAKYLAANGRHHAALSLLDRSIPKQSAPPLSILLLKAKILAQLGDNARAIEYWNRVLNSEPQNSEAQAGIRRARNASRPMIGRLFRYSSSFQVCAVLLLIVIGSVVYFTTRIAASGLDAVEPHPMVATADLVRQLSDLQERLRSLEVAAVQAPSAAPESGPSGGLIVQLRDDFEDRISRSDIARQKLADQLSQLAKDFDAFGKLHSSQAATTEENLGQLTGEIEAQATRIDRAVEDTQVKWQQLNSRFDNFTDQSNRRRLDALAADAQQWMIMDLVYRNFRNDSRYRANRLQIHLSLEKVLIEIEKIPGNEQWDNFIIEGRKFLENAQVRN